MTTHDHVLQCLPHKYAHPVTDGASIWLHIGCHCGHSTHVTELEVAWRPQPATVACLWCHRPLEHRGNRKYHVECAGPAKQAQRRAYERMETA